MAKVEQDSGVLFEDEEVFANLCLLEDKRYKEIRGIFIKHGLVVEDEEAHLVIVNWAEYQLGESTTRVRAHRARQKDETLPKRECNANETGDIDIEREEEEGDARAREDAPPHEDLSANPEARPLLEASGASPPIPTPKPSHLDIARNWYARRAKETGSTIRPSKRDFQLSRELMDRIGGDLEIVNVAIETYFTRWNDLWFARTPRAPPYRTDFSFGAFCRNFAEIIDRQKDPTPHENQGSWSTGEPPTEEEIKKPDDQDLASAAEAMQRAASSNPGAAKLLDELRQKREKIIS
jgi:hypothetical protein